MNGGKFKVTRVNQPQEPDSIAEDGLDSRPNIVFILVDDLGYGDFSAELMPKSTALMQTKGTTLNLYAMQNCVPTRVAFITGKDPSKLNLHGVDAPPLYAGLPIKEVTIAERLQQAGYKTGVFGKWHLGLERDQSPLANGFDVFTGISHGWINYYGHSEQPYSDGTHGHDHHNAHDMQVNGKPLLSEQYSTFLFRDATNTFINNVEEPFFAYVPFNAPHTPYAAPREYVEQFREASGITDNEFALIATYADDVMALPARAKIEPEQKLKIDQLLYNATVRALDDAVADIYENLESAGKAENTLFIFASDNGAANFSDKQLSGGLRGGKGSPFEGGHYVANFVIWPSQIAVNQAVDSQIWVGDLYPTFLEVAGSSTQYMVDVIDGHAALTTLTSNAHLDRGQDDYIVHHIDKRRKFPGQGIDQDLLDEDITSAAVAIVSGNIKYIHTFSYFTLTNEPLSENEYIYDLATDPRESRNLLNVERYADELHQMRLYFEHYGGDEYLLNLRPIGAPPGVWRGYDLPLVWGFPGTPQNELEFVTADEVESLIEQAVLEDPS